MTLTPAATLIKNHMLNWPTIFDSRWKTLCFLLLVSNPENSWGSDGKVHSFSVSQNNDQGLDSAKKKLENQYNDTIESATHDSEILIVEAKHVLEKHLFILNNIDVLANHQLSFQEKVRDADFVCVYADSLLFTAPSNMEASWKAVVLDFLSQSISYLESNHYLPRDKENISEDLFNWTDSFWLSIYQRMKAKQLEINPDIAAHHQAAKSEISALWDTCLNGSQV